MKNKQLSKGEERFLKDKLKNMSKEEVAQLSPDMILKPGVGQSLTPGESMQFMKELTQMTQGMTPRELKKFMKDMEGIELP